MTDRHETQALPMLVTDEQGLSAWAEQAWPTEQRGGMILSPRVGCGSLRLRQSEPGYFADWHVAGDPVLIIVRRGTLRIGLRSGEARDFGAGDAFIAADRVPDGKAFNADVHGHTAEVVGDAMLEAIHIKLEDVA